MFWKAFKNTLRISNDSVRRNRGLHYNLICFFHHEPHLASFRYANTPLASYLRNLHPQIHYNFSMILIQYSNSLLLLCITEKMSPPTPFVPNARPQPTTTIVPNLQSPPDITIISLTQHSLPKFSKKKKKKQNRQSSYQSPPYLSTKPTQFLPERNLHHNKKCLPPPPTDNLSPPPPSQTNTSAQAVCAKRVF